MPRGNVLALYIISSMTKRPLGELAVSGYIRRQNRREFTGLRHCSTLYAGGAFEQPFPLLSITMPFLASFSMSSMPEQPLSLGAVHVPAMRAQRNLGFHLRASFLCRKP
jgi:hypothetical protein